MTAELPSRDALPPIDPLALLAPVEWEGERVLGTYDRMTLHHPFRAYPFTITLDEQREYCRSTSDEAALYLEGTHPPAHPGLVMAQGSRVVAHQFVMPFWIHAASVLRHRRVVRVGDPVELHCVPIEKWKRGESEWVRFYQVYLVEGEPTIEVWKTSVIKVAPRPTVI
jgi:acyl dehydratase